VLGKNKVFTGCLIASLDKPGYPHPIGNSMDVYAIEGDIFNPLFDAQSSALSRFAFDSDVGEGKMKPGVSERSFEYILLPATDNIKNI
jgi:hypothetical protein